MDTKEWKAAFWPTDRETSLQRLASAYGSVALVCVVGAAVAGGQWVVGASEKAGQMAGYALGIGLLLLAATSGMLNYYRVWRNVAGITAVCLLWVMGEGVSRLIGIPMIVACIPAVLLGACSMSYFTSRAGREVFRRGSAQEDAGEN